MVIVKPEFPANDLAQFMEYARAHPNRTAGDGSEAAQISVGQIRRLCPQRDPAMDVGCQGRRHRSKIVAITEMAI